MTTAIASISISLSCRHRDRACRTIFPVPVRAVFIPLRRFPLHCLSLEPPMIFEADPLMQPDPVPYQGFTVDAGQNVSIHQGQSLRVNARIVGGVPDPLIEWTLPDGSKLGPGEASNGVRVTQNGALRIDDVRRSHEGTYTVTATNSQGTDTASTTLKVLRE